MRFFLILEGAPVSKKNTWAPGRNKDFSLRLYQRDKGVKSYVESLRIQSAFQLKRQGALKIAKPEKVAIRFRVYFRSVQGSMDCHNAIETVLDALQGVCYDNDNQVVGVFHPPIRLVDDSKPRVEVEICSASYAATQSRWQ